MENEFIVSVDIGTVKTRILVSEVCEDGEIKIIGAVANPSSGVSKGRVADPEKLSEVLRLSKEEAERMSGVEIEGACVSVSNADIRSFDSRGMLTTGGGDQGVTEDDISQVTRNAQNIPLPSDRMVLHAVQQFFTVDGEGGIVNPLGMKASRLERGLHIVTTLKEHFQALDRVLKSCGIEVIETAFAPIAVSRSALNYTDREEGTLVIDIGGEVTSYVYYYGGVVRSSGVLPVGGFNVSNDMAIGLGLPFGVAEALKRKAGVGGAESGASQPAPDGSRRPAGSREPDLERIAEVVQPRCRELFSLIRDDLSGDPHFGMMRGRIVLSGGGSMLKGVERIAGEVFSRDVSRHVPAGFSGLSEMLDDQSWDTAAGLLLVGREKLERLEEPSAGGCFDWFRQGLRKVVKTF